MATQPTPLTFFNDDLKQNLSERLKRIEGQARGIDKMLQEDKPCPQVLQQLAAVKSALHGVSTMVLRNYLETCVAAAIQSGDLARKDAVMNELMEVVKKFAQ